MPKTRVVPIHESKKREIKNKRQLRKKNRLKPLIPGRNNNRGSGNYEVRVADIIKPGNARIKPGVAVKGVGNIPESIAVSYPVTNSFFGNYRWNVIRSYRSAGLLPVG
jgi:hypothetical protein